MILLPTCNWYHLQPPILWLYCIIGVFRFGHFPCITFSSTLCWHLDNHFLPLSFISMYRQCLCFGNNWYYIHCQQLPESSTSDCYLCFPCCKKQPFSHKNHSECHPDEDINSQSISLFSLKPKEWRCTCNSGWHSTFSFMRLYYLRSSWYLCHSCCQPYLVRCKIRGAAYCHCHSCCQLPALTWTPATVTVESVILNTFTTWGQFKIWEIYGYTPVDTVEWEQLLLL